jgi:hypothetical protein
MFTPYPKNGSFARVGGAMMITSDTAGRQCRLAVSVLSGVICLALAAYGQTTTTGISCYAGDYDYSTALNNTAYVTWTDGRVAVSGVQVQNVEFAAAPEP